MHGVSQLSVCKQLPTRSGLQEEMPWRAEDLLRGSIPAAVQLYLHRHGGWSASWGGDRLQVPLDGEVVHGRSLVSMEHITGEALPAPRGVGDELPAGARNHDGALVLRALRPAADSTPARIARLTLDAQVRRLPATPLGRAPPKNDCHE